MRSDGNADDDDDNDDDEEERCSSTVATDSGTFATMEKSESEGSVAVAVGTSIVGSLVAMLLVLWRNAVDGLTSRSSGTLSCDVGE